MALVLGGTLCLLAWTSCQPLRARPARVASDAVLPEREAVAEVDGVPISLARFNELFKERADHAAIAAPLSPQGAFRLKAAIAQEMVDALLVEREARRRGFAEHADVRELRDRLIALDRAAPASQSSAQAFFEATRPRWGARPLAASRIEVHRALRDELRASAGERLIRELRMRAKVVDHLAARYPDLAAAAAIKFRLGDRTSEEMVNAPSRGGVPATSAVVPAGSLTE